MASAGCRAVHNRRRRRASIRTSSRRLRCASVLSLGDGGIRATSRKQAAGVIRTRKQADAADGASPACFRKVARPDRGRMPWHPRAAKATYSGGAMDNFWVNAIFSIVPTLLVGVIFWIIMRSIIRMDRTERKVYARIEAEERARLGLDSPAR